MNRRPLLIAALLHALPMAIVNAGNEPWPDLARRPAQPREPEPLPESNYRRKVPKTEADHAAIERAEAKRARKAAARAPK